MQGIGTGICLAPGRRYLGTCPLFSDPGCLPIASRAPAPSILPLAVRHLDSMFAICSIGVVDNRIAEMRRKISSLRAEMLEVGDSIRNLIKLDKDCTEASMRLMAMRTEMVGLVRQRKTSGGDDRCPTIEERLKENYRPRKSGA